MSLKNAGKNVFGKEDGALEAFRRYLELDEKSEATIRKYMLNNTTGTTGQWSGTSFQSDFLMGRRSWALLLWVVLWLATLTMGGHWKSIAYARTAHAMPVQCFTQPHGGRPARWDISVW